MSRTGHDSIASSLTWSSSFSTCSDDSKAFYNDVKEESKWMESSYGIVIVYIHHDYSIITVYTYYSIDIMKIYENIWKSICIIYSRFSSLITLYHNDIRWNQPESTSPTASCQEFSFKAANARFFSRAVFTWRGFHNWRDVTCKACKATAQRKLCESSRSKAHQQKWNVKAIFAGIC